MATGPLTRVSDVVVPSIFSPYVQQMTERKSRLIRSGALARSAFLDGLLAGGGKTFDIPSFKDLDNDTDNVSGDQVADQLAWTALSGTAVGGNYPTLNDAVPKKIETATEVAVRLSRNQSWSSANLAATLAGADPMGAIASRVANYWAERLQAAFVATVSGVCRDNGTNDSGDYANDVVGGAFVDGMTNFTATNFLNATVTMGDSLDKLSMMMVHSTVYNRMRIQNMIDFRPDSEQKVDIPFFQGLMVIVDDNVPSGSSVVRADGSAGSGAMYETWIFGAGAVQMGMGSPPVPTEIERHARAGNGGGQDVLVNRQEWIIHPVGHAYTGMAANGGPGNTTGSNDLNNAGSWNRVYPERKQISFARLITREA